MMTPFKKNSRGMEGYMKIIQKINELLCIIALTIMVILVFSQVLGRYVFGWSVSWGEELTRFLLVWISFLGVALAAKKRANINIDAFVNLLHGKAKIAVDVLGDNLNLAFWVYVGLSGISMLTQNGDQSSPAMQVPMSVIYIAIPVCGLLIFLYIIEEYWKKYLARDRKRKED
jgi:TRAP-type C4-dicarboxylate transport system permease small subunit